MPSSRSGAWKPKAFRPSDPPSVVDIKAFLASLEGDDEVLNLFLNRSNMTPAERLHYASGIVLDKLLKETTRTNELFNLLDREEYIAYLRVSQMPLPVKLKSTAEFLLCLQDRYIISSFFRRAFNDLRAHCSYVYKK